MCVRCCGDFAPLQTAHQAAAPARRVCVSHSLTRIERVGDSERANEGQSWRREQLNTLACQCTFPQTFTRLISLCCLSLNFRALPRACPRSLLDLSWLCTARFCALSLASALRGSLSLPPCFNLWVSRSPSAFLAFRVEVCERAIRLKARESARSLLRARAL